MHFFSEDNIHRNICTKYLSKGTYILYTGSVFDQVRIKRFATAPMSHAVPLNIFIINFYLKLIHSFYRRYYWNISSDKIRK